MDDVALHAGELFASTSSWISVWAGEGQAAFLTRALWLFGALVLGWLGHALLMGLNRRYFQALAQRTETRADDVLVDARVIDRLAWILPGVTVVIAAPVISWDAPALARSLDALAWTYVILMVTLAVNAFLKALHLLYRASSMSRERSIKSYVQMSQLLVSLAGIILMIATLTNTSPWPLISGLGAMTAVLLLIFRDTILGFVASIQIGAQDLVRLGDWVEVPHLGADGEVEDITLAAVKVKNWDNTTSMVPTYALVTNAFKNWRSMGLSGGRRIKRSLSFDVNSVSFCTEEDLKRFRKMTLLRPYLDEKLKEIEAYNAAHDGDLDEVVNGRRLTNLGTFRAYTDAYLRSREDIRKDMTFLVRQLQPTDKGVPIEIYVFSAQTSWPLYEGIQADIFDHLFAVAPEFGLRVLQVPSGADVRSLHANER